MARKNLNDTIHGDRSVVRGHHAGANVTRSWDDFKKDKDRKDELDKIFDSAGSKSSTNSNQKSFNLVPSGSGNKSSGQPYNPCYHTHPDLILPGTDKVIYGGSCINPVVKDADIYIGFDSGMTFTQRSWPWKKGTEFLFKIRDMEAPADAAEFIKLVDWVKSKLDDGAKVHCGCIGGHGRTGTFMSALASRYGEDDAITYVRKHYCDRAVESTAQVKFLQDNFGIKPAEGYKSKPSKFQNSAPSKGSNSPTVYEPMKGRGSIWEKAS
jgi:hypothetical protein